jgi:hypothetical protein
MRLRTVVILSPHFPPSTLAGVHRARHLARRLPDHAWRPIVVRADERFYTEPNEPDLAALVPADLEQVRVGACPAAIARRFGVGDIGLRAWPQFRRALGQTLARERPDAVMITGSPFYPMLLAPGLRRRFRVPVILDFQDPWVSAHGARQAPGSKAWLAHRLAVMLEPKAVHAAAWVTSVSEGQNDEMAARYPWLDRSRMSAIPIGGDPEDFAALRQRPAPEGLLDPSRINLCYVGTFLPRAGPLTAVLFAALADLRASKPGLTERLRLNFIGTSNQPDGAGGGRVRPLAEAAGVGDLVAETPRRIPYLAALGVLANSDGLLLIGSDEPHYTASKIYPALLSGRPWLSLFHQASSAHAILSDASGGVPLAFATNDDLQALRPTLAAAIERLASAPETLGKARPEAIAPFTASAVAGAFAEVFERAARP